MRFDFEQVRSHDSGATSTAAQLLATVAASSFNTFRRIARWTAALIEGDTKLLHCACRRSAHGVDLPPSPRYCAVAALRDIATLHATVSTQ